MNIHIPRWLVYILGLVSLGLIALVYYLVDQKYGNIFEFKTFAWTSFWVLMYLLSAHFIRPEPDMNDLGWFGGLIDNPFRYRDDMNRLSLAIKIILIPGLLIASIFVASYKQFFTQGDEEDTE